MTRAKTLYDTLEVSQTASVDEIKKSYHNLAWRYERYGGTASNEERMKEINHAYEVLSNTEERKQYDKDLERQRLIAKTRERAERIRAEREARKRNDAEVKKYGEGIRGHPPPSKPKPPPSPPYSPPPIHPPPTHVPPHTTPSTRFLSNLLIKLGGLVAAVAFAAAPLGIMALMVPFENANQHNIIVDMLGLAVGLTCIVWILAGLAALWAAIGNLFSDWS
jgi:curved DNA-binding protein CbpA